MGPPPGQPAGPPVHYPAAIPNYRPPPQAYGDPTAPSLASTHSIHYGMNPDQLQYRQSPFQPPREAATSMSSQQSAVDDIEMRPRVNRTDTQASVTPTTRKSKAVDLS